jgi:hypothetical protein
MRAILIAALLALFLVAPAQAAPAKETSKKAWPIPVVGIGEQNPAMFASPYFKALKVKHVRVVTAWDSLRHRWSRQALDQYMFAARDAGVKVLLGFGHARSKKRKVRRNVPSVKVFTKEFLKYKKRYPWQKEWLTWNEANHCGEPTCHKARRVARFYNNIRHNCYGCTVVAADVLDTPTMPAWVREFRRTARDDKVIWGLHNYIDANRFRTKGTKALLKAAPKGKVWFTETGGLVVRRNGSRIAFPGNRRHAAKATRQVFKLARLSKRIRRVYIYHWMPQAVKLPTWDSALMDPRGYPRPAYKVLKSFLRRFALEAALRRERAREEAQPKPAPTPAPTPTPTSGGAPAPEPSPTPAP